MVAVKLLKGKSDSRVLKGYADTTFPVAHLTNSYIDRPSQAAYEKFNSELKMLTNNMLEHPNVVSLLGVSTIVSFVRRVSVL